MRNHPWCASCPSSISTRSTACARGRFPEFFYLPREPGVLPVPSLARLAELRGVFEPHLDPLDLRLRDEIRGIVGGHLRFLMTGVSVGDFHAYREPLLHSEARGQA